MKRSVLMTRVVAGTLLILAVIFGAAHDWGGRLAGTYYLIGLALAIVAVGLIVWTNRQDR